MAERTYDASWESGETCDRSARAVHQPGQAWGGDALCDRHAHLIDGSPADVRDRIIDRLDAGLIPDGTDWLGEDGAVHPMAPDEVAYFERRASDG